MLYSRKERFLLYAFERLLSEYVQLCVTTKCNPIQRAAHSHTNVVFFCKKNGQEKKNLVNLWRIFFESTEAKRFLTLLENVKELCNINVEKQILYGSIDKYI